MRSSRVKTCLQNYKIFTGFGLYVPSSVSRDRFEDKMKLFNTPALAVLACIVLTSNAFAGESEKDHLALQADKQAGIECIPTKDFIKVLEKLSRLTPKQTDTVGILPVMTFEAKDGGALPERVFYRNQGEEHAFHIDATGAVPDFANVKSMDKKGEMCMQDKTRIAAPEDAEGLELSIEMELLYKNKSGLYTMAELADGLKDGRAHIKKIVPAPVRLLIPKFTHLEIGTKDGQAVTISALKNGVIVEGLTILDIEGSKIVDYKQLELLGADHLKVSGREFTVGPMPSPDDIKDRPASK